MLFKEARNSIQHFSKIYILKDDHCHYLTSDATIIVIYKCPIMDKQVAVIYFTWQFTIATIWPAKNTRSFSFKPL